MSRDPYHFSPLLRQREDTKKGEGKVFERSGEAEAYSGKPVASSAERPNPEAQYNPYKKLKIAEKKKEECWKSNEH
jgi:hypothetical protein